MELLYDDRAGAALPEDLENILTDLLRQGLQHVSAPVTHTEISLSVVTGEEIQALNRDYRNQDKETDVLSFPFYEPPLPAEDELPLALGDIVICAKVAEEQAVRYGHSYLRELAFLAVHGLLHLLGYDHETENDEQIMTALQEEILNKAGISRA